MGKACGNFGDKGCKGGFEHSPWSWARWYIEARRRERAQMLDLTKLVERIK